MKRTLDAAEKTRRQAWRNLAYENRVSDVTRTFQHTPKALRYLRPVETVKLSEKPVVQIDMRQRLADMFKGYIYRGAYVQVTHKQAFAAREAKRRAAHDAAELAAGAQTINEIIAKDDSAFRTVVQD